MLLLNKISHHLKKTLGFGSIKETDPEKAYDLWAECYDQQPDNLMLALDETVFSFLLNTVDVNQKIIADIGCGTGRHWKKILENHPSSVIGFDVSEKMLKRLKEKYPNTQTSRLKDNMLTQLQNNSIDVLISTLTLAHIENIEQAFVEWHRVLKPEGNIIITDYHPATLAKGGNRTFDHNGKLVAIKNYVHPLSQLRAIANKMNLREVNFIERNIDETVKHYYQKQNALQVFEKYKGTAIIYGIHLKKLYDIVQP